MLCSELKELLMQVALDEANAGERAQVDAHIAACQACRQAFAEWRLTRKMVQQGLPQEEPPQRIHFVSSKRQAAGFAGWIWQRAFALPVGAAAGIAILLFSLALSGARVSAIGGNWELAFGRPAAAERVSSAQPAAASDTFTREQVAQLLAAAIRESEQRQRAETARFVEQAIGQADQRHQVAVRDLQTEVSSFERAQNYFYKQNENTLYALQLIEKRLPNGKGETQ